MYFWRIEKLKTTMATKTLSEREVLPYIIASIILVTIFLGAMRHMPITSYWDDISSILNVVLAVIGTIYIYHRNNGADGQHFLQRYIVISWVISVRWFAAFLVAFTIFFSIIMAFNVSKENTELATFIFNSVASAILYWRIGYHVHDLAQRTIAQ